MDNINRGNDKIKKRRKKRSGKKSRRTIISICVIVLLAVLVGFSAYHIVTLKMEQKTLQSQNQQLIKEKKKLQKQLDSANDPSNIEKQARVKLHMVKPGETIFVLPNKNSSN